MPLCWLLAERRQFVNPGTKLDPIITGTKQGDARNSAKRDTAVGEVCLQRGHHGDGGDDLVVGCGGAEVRHYPTTELRVENFFLDEFGDLNRKQRPIIGGE